MPWLARRPVKRVVATVIFFVAFGGDALRNSINWWGWGIAAALCIVTAIAMWVSCRVAIARRGGQIIRWDHVSGPITVFLGWCLISTIWSHYRAETLAGWSLQAITAFIGFALASSMSWKDIATALRHALTVIVGFSLLFEVAVALIVRGPILPIWNQHPGPHPALSNYWSRGTIFHGAAIQGIQGNRNLLAFTALLALILVLIEIARRVSKWRRMRKRRRLWTLYVAGLLAAVALVLTRSATVEVAAAAVIIATLAALLARRLSQLQRWTMYIAFAVVVAVGFVVTILERNHLLSMFHRSDDLTGRVAIWDKVIHLASEHPLLGWGWISYWAPWVKPFDGLAVRKGTAYLQAHNAFLDVWLQVGVIGAAIFVFLVAMTTARSWWIAIDPSVMDPRRPTLGPAYFAPRQLGPLLLCIALLVQSLAESRLLIEGNWLLLCTLAIVTKQGMHFPLVSDPVRTARRQAPVTVPVPSTLKQ